MTQRLQVLALYQPPPAPSGYVMYSNFGLKSLSGEVWTRESLMRHVGSHLGIPEQDVWVESFQPGNPNLVSWTSYVRVRHESVVNAQRQKVERFLEMFPLL